MTWWWHMETFMRRMEHLSRFLRCFFKHRKSSKDLEEKHNKRKRYEKHVPKISYPVLWSGDLKRTSKEGSIGDDGLFWIHDRNQGKGGRNCVW